MVRGRSQTRASCEDTLYTYPATWIMSDEQEAIDRNFRSAYYKSLGVRGSEKSITHLEQLLKAELFGMLTYIN